MLCLAYSMGLLWLYSNDKEIAAPSFAGLAMTCWRLEVGGWRLEYKNAFAVMGD